MPCPETKLKGSVVKHFLFSGISEWKWHQTFTCLVFTVWLFHLKTVYVKLKGKGKRVPLQDWTGF